MKSQGNDDIFTYQAPPESVLFENTEELASDFNDNEIRKYFYLFSEKVNEQNIDMISSKLLGN